MQTSDDLLTSDQVLLPHWRRSAVRWTSLVGLLHGLAGALIALGMLLSDGGRSLWAPALLLVTPATVHLVGSIGIARRGRWAVRMEYAFTPIHIVLVLIAMLYPFLMIGLARSFGGKSPELDVVIISCMFGLLLLAPLLGAMYYLRKFRELSDRDAINRPAFEVIRRGSGE